MRTIGDRSRRVGSFAFAAAVLTTVTYVLLRSIPISSPLAAAQGVPAVSLGASSCSFETFAQELNLDVSDPPQQMTTAELATATANARSQYPNATIIATRPALLASALTPMLNGRSVILVRLTNLPGVAGAGPPDARVGPLPSDCGVAIYDATTGAWISTYGELAN